MKKHNIFLSIVWFISFGIVVGLLFIYNFLVPMQRLLLIGILLTIAAIIILAMLYTDRFKNAIFCFLLVLLIVIQCLASLYLFKSFQTLHNISRTQTNTGADNTKPDDVAIAKDVGTGESFIIYITGIDQYGSIEGVSRSDVNILLSVNPSTGKILMVSIPRDSYVQIAGDGNDEYDKLTHSGIYGVNSSIRTLENLFGIQINYYFRVNFSSVISIVDVLGGIEVDNPRGFEALGGEYYFPEGVNYLSGEEALAFARERYNLGDGDLDRGRNQERVIAAMIQKATSPSILFNYTGLLDVISEEAQTNMPVEKITELINQQISEGTNWDIRNAELRGEGVTGLPSYAMPDYELYMFRLDEDSVNEVKREIEAIQSGGNFN